MPRIRLGWISLPKSRSILPNASLRLSCSGRLVRGLLRLQPRSGRQVSAPRCLATVSSWPCLEANSAPRCLYPSPQIDDALVLRTRCDQSASPRPPHATLPHLRISTPLTPRLNLLWWILGYRAAAAYSHSASSPQRAERYIP